MFSNTSLIVYGLLLAFVIFIGIYVWRRIYMLESYTNILEKKVTNLKKENKELQDLLHNGDNTCSFDTADSIMNKIFNMEKAKIEEPSIVNISVEAVKTTSNPSKHDVNDDTKIILNDVDKDIADLIDNSRDHNTKDDSELPVAKHIDEPEKDAEIESVVSDNHNVYNRKKLSKMNLDKLKEICVSLNISHEGTKNNLIDRILS